MKCWKNFMLFITLAVLITAQLYAVSEEEVNKITEAMPAKGYPPETCRLAIDSS